MNQFFKYLPIILLSPFYLILGVFSFWAIQQAFPPAVVTIADYKPKTVAVGDSVEITYNVVWNRDCLYKITKILKNENQKFALGYVERYHKATEPSIFTATVDIPLYIPEGEYEYISEVNPICNPFDSFSPYILPEPPIKVTIDNTPTILFSLKIENETVRVKEPILLENKFNKKRTCSASVDTFIKNTDNVLVAKASRPSTVAILGPGKFKEQFNIDLPPGDYTLDRSIIYSCPEKTYLLAYPTNHFKVIS